MPNSTLERSIVINAPIQRVWDAVTDPAQLAQWFLPPALGAQIQKDDQGRLSVLMGPMSAQIAAFEQVEPPRTVTMRTLPDGVVTTTYLFEELPDATRVTVRMRGLDALEDSGSERLAPSGAGWEKALANLKAFVDGASLPHPEGYIAALFGYRRQGAQKISVERTIWINAPIQRVWNAVTDPRQIQAWFSPGTEWHSSGSEVGATLSVIDPQTGAHMYTQVVEEIEPPRVLVTRTLPTPEETVKVTRWLLTEENGGTRLAVIHSGYENDPDAARHDPMEQNAFGFGMMLENVKAVAEGAEVPYPFGF